MFITIGQSGAVTTVMFYVILNMCKTHVKY
jgi:hypothetical protein